MADMQIGIQLQELWLMLGQKDTIIYQYEKEISALQQAVAQKEKENAELRARLGIGPKPDPRLGRMGNPDTPGPIPGIRLISPSPGSPSAVSAEPRTDDGRRQHDATEPARPSDANDRSDGRGDDGGQHVSGSGEPGNGDSEPTAPEPITSAS